MSSRGGTRFQPIRVAEECSLSSHLRRSGMHWEILDRWWCFRIGGPGECLASGPGSLPVPQTSQLDRSPICPRNPPYQEEVASRWRCRDSNWSSGFGGSPRRGGAGIYKYPLPELFGKRARVSACTAGTSGLQHPCGEFSFAWERQLGRGLAGAGTSGPGILSWTTTREGTGCVQSGTLTVSAGRSQSSGCKCQQVSLCTGFP